MRPARSVIGRSRMMNFRGCREGFEACSAGAIAKAIGSGGRVIGEHRLGRRSRLQHRVVDGPDGAEQSPANRKNCQCDCDLRVEGSSFPIRTLFTKTPNVSYVRMPVAENPAKYFSTHLQAVR